MNRQKQLYQEQRAKALALLGGVCVDCGTSKSLEFDHVIARDKGYEIGTRFGRVRFETLLPELLKCALRCKKCHTEKTIKSGEIPPPIKPTTHGDLAMYMTYKCRCDICKKKYQTWHREYRIKKGETTGKRGFYSKEIPAHGDIRSYRKGCRCSQCRKANAEKQKSLRHARVVQRQETLP